MSMDYELSPWAWPVLLLDAIFLIPLWLLVDYTLMRIYPVFAIIENENPPAYDPVALPSSHAAAASTPRAELPLDHQSDAVTSSLRAVNRLLTSHGGFRANFRGFFCALAQHGLAAILASLFSLRAFKPLATLLASLTLVQYGAAWVHIVVSPPSPRPFWRRLPPFRHTFDATWRPVVLHWAAVEVAAWLPRQLAAVLGVEVHDVDMRFGAGSISQASDALRAGDVAFLWKCLLLALISGVLFVSAVIPARVILVRVQASLLPVEEDVIIPFDRSFQGKVEPAVVGGTGYATISDAWTTFSKAGWRRLVVLYVKIILVSLAALLLSWTVLVPEAMLLLKPAGVPSR